MPLPVAVPRGLVAGFAVTYLLVVGIFERFSDRNILADVLTLGWVVIALIFLGSGAWVAFGRLAGARLSTARVPPGAAIARGAVAGAVAGALPAVFLLAAQAVNLRPVLVNVTPTLVELLSVAGDAPAGALRLVGAGALLGLTGAALRLLPLRLRRPLVVAVGTVLLVSLLEPLLRVALVGLGFDTSWLYRRGGLTATGAALVFVVVGVLALAWAWRGQEIRARVQQLDPRGQQGLRLAWLLAVAVVLLAVPQFVGSFLSEVAGTVGLFVLLGIGLNIVVGYAGMLHLGFVAFFAVGAYTTAILTSPAAALGAELSFWAALPFVVLVTAFVGVLVGAPVLRLRGDYLAIVTLAFGEIARILVLSDWLRPATGGAQGILQIPAPTFAGVSFRDPEALYYLILLASLAAAYVARQLEDSRVGRAWTAMREDEQVAQLMGINISRYKLLAFAIGAGIGSLAGAFFAVKIGSVFPHSFSILVSITALSVVILGGIGSLPGVVLGAIVLVGLPDLLREFGEYRLLIYGGLLVAIMILRPQGLVPNVRRSRELADDERLQDQWLQRAGAGDREPAVTARVDEEPS